MTIKPETIAEMRQNWETSSAEAKTLPGYAEVAEKFDREYEVAVAKHTARMMPRTRKPTHPEGDFEFAEVLRPLRSRTATFGSKDCPGAATSNGVKKVKFI